MSASLTSLLLRALVVAGLSLTPTTAPAAPLKSTLHVLTVGVSKYKVAAATVLGPDKGARAVAELFRGQVGKLYQRVEQAELLNEKATRAAILAELDRLQTQASRDDTTIVYLCGHGGMVEGQWYFFSHDATFKGGEGVLAGRQLKKRLANVPGKVVLILDSCHSGGFVDGAEAINQIQADNLAVFTSSRFDEVSRVQETEGVGLYTLALVEALQGKADANGDGFVTLDEVAVYVAQRVHGVTRKTPLSAEVKMQLLFEGIRETQTPHVRRARAIRADTALAQVAGTSRELVRALGE